MLLHHLHIPRPVYYNYAYRIENSIVAQHLDHKAFHGASPRGTAPAPTLLTFQSQPTYTCGRREAGAISAQQEAHLRAGGAAEFYEAKRGGQTTFHGPGQLTAYLVCELDAHGLRPWQYVRFLEASAAATCARFGVRASASADADPPRPPGVWVSDGEKICSVGVHLRRYVSSQGLGLNVHTDLRWFDRIVACGLPDKRVTSLEAQGVAGVSVDDVADVLAEEMARGLAGVRGVERRLIGDDAAEEDRAAPR